MRVSGHLDLVLDFDGVRLILFVSGPVPVGQALLQVPPLRAKLLGAENAPFSVPW